MVDLLRGLCGGRACSSLLTAVVLSLAACAPAAPPIPTAGPAAKPTVAPAPQPTSAPAAVPTSVPASKPTSAPPAATPTSAPTAKPSSNEAVADFYRGKVIHLVVGSPPGGGYDTYGRAIARHIGTHIPGNPTVVVDNMPGAGGAVSVDHVYSAAPRDGTVIVHFQGGVVAQQLLGGTSSQSDATKLQYLGSPVGDSAVLFLMKRTGVTSLDQLIGPNAKEVALGGNAPGSMNIDVATLLRDVIGAKIKVVPGYSGSAPIRLAMESGELDGFVNAWESTKTSNLAEVESGAWTTVFQLTDKPHKDLPTIPTIPDITKDEEKRQLLRYGYAIPGQFARPFAVAPGVPAERVQALRDAFQQTLKDPEFLADTAKGNLLLDPLTGDELNKLIQGYTAMPANLKPILKKILAPGG